MALNRLCAQLAFSAKAKGVLLLDEDGDELARAGACELSAGRTHISIVGRAERANPTTPSPAQRAILIILHDERTSAALVRQRAREARPRFERVLDERLAPRAGRA